MKMFMPTDDEVAFVVDLYHEGETIPSDCLPEFFATREAAERAGEAEVARVLAMPLRGEYDWAVAYTIRRCDPDPE